MPTRAAASAHWCLRCSVGATTVTASTTRQQLAGHPQGEGCLAGPQREEAAVVLIGPGRRTSCSSDMRTAGRCAGNFSERDRACRGRVARARSGGATGWTVSVNLMSVTALSMQRRVRAAEQGHASSDDVLARGSLPRGWAA